MNDNSIQNLPIIVRQRVLCLGIHNLRALQEFFTFSPKDLAEHYFGCNTFAIQSHLSSNSPNPSAHRLESGGGGGRSNPPIKLLSRNCGLLAQSTDRSFKAVMPNPTPKTDLSQSLKDRVFHPERYPIPRNQGRRGTCVSFASTALLEFHLSKNQEYKSPRHSEEFLFWGCKKHDNYPGQDGTDLESAIKVLEQMGSCYHTSWPYDHRKGSCVGHGPPPKGAEAQAKQFRLSSISTLNTGSILSPTTFCSILENQPIVVGVLVYKNWFFPDVGESGYISLPLPGTKPEGAHAICLVGYELRKDTPGGGVFIFRNSWGRNWGSQSPFGRGYGSFPFEYLSMYHLHDGVVAFY